MIGSEIDVAAYKIDIGSGIDRKGKVPNAVSRYHCSSLAEAGFI